MRPCCYPHKSHAIFKIPATVLQPVLFTCFAAFLYWPKHSFAVFQLSHQRDSQPIVLLTLNLRCYPCNVLPASLKPLSCYPQRYLILLFQLPHQQDLQHFSCWHKNLFCCLPTALSMGFTAFCHADSRISQHFVMLTQESLLLSLNCHLYRTRSICHAGS
jgi:hypothetical protein